MKKQKLILTALALGLTVLTSCEKENFESTNQQTSSGALSKENGNNSVGAVYIMDNSTSGNHVLVYQRSAAGALVNVSNVSTNGIGTGGGLGSQGSLILSDDNEFLLACNAGSNDVTVFKVNGINLILVDKISSGGVRPISITSHEDYVYVLNAGGTGNISGFQLTDEGHLNHISGSERELSGPSVGAAQIEFNKSGTQLIVTEKATNNILSYAINSNGMASLPTIHPSVGNTPFGFEFGKNDVLIVSDAFGGMPGASALTSYSLSNAGSLNVVSGPIATTQTAACWVVVTNNNKYCYTTNTASGNISGYKISDSGSLTLLQSNGISGITEASPIDMSLSNNSKFLYTLNSMSHSISMFKVNNQGELTSLGTLNGLPAGSVGMAAH